MLSFFVLNNLTLKIFKKNIGSEERYLLEILVILVILNWLSYADYVLLGSKISVT